MALDYSKCAGEICEHVGGASNILSADHCDTRLRLVLADMDQADRDALEEIEGVRAALESNGQLQLIIGTGVVNKVFDELRPIIGSKGGSGKEAGPASGQPVSGSVPAALVAGILGALVVLLLRSGILSGNAAGMQTLLTTVNVILCVIAFAVCGVLVFLFTGVNRRKRAHASEQNVPLLTVQAPSETVISCEDGKVIAPAVGEVIARAAIPGEPFASGILGDGVGINPKEGVIFAPFDGKIASVADFRNAVVIRNEAGMEVLIHVGVDTADMNGSGFKTAVKKGDQVKAGQVIMTFDRDQIAKAGHSDCVVVLLSNADRYNNFRAGVGV